jgi:hypothetical protein
MYHGSTSDTTLVPIYCNLAGSSLKLSFERGSALLIFLRNVFIRMFNKQILCCRINQRYLIATKTKVDISAVKVSLPFSFCILLATYVM